ncbi:MAG TPA: hypothetical protein VMW30_08540 [Candidatus Paceibacterota bacterium]|nr:hypothetical protein [Candidatus Paceibacterota bacterium]
MTFYQGGNGRTAVLLPGRSYSPNHPVLYYARQVLQVQGWSVEEVRNFVYSKSSYSRLSLDPL